MAVGAVVAVGVVAFVGVAVGAVVAVGVVAFAGVAVGSVVAVGAGIAVDPAVGPAVGVASVEMGVTFGILVTSGVLAASRVGVTTVVGAGEVVPVSMAGVGVSTTVGFSWVISSGCFTVLGSFMAITIPATTQITNAAAAPATAPIRDHFLLAFVLPDLPVMPAESFCGAGEAFFASSSMVFGRCFMYFFRSSSLWEFAGFIRVFLPFAVVF